MAYFGGWPCESYRAEIAQLRAELDAVRVQLREVLKLCALQKADLDRLTKASEAPSAPPPHQPERVPTDQLQLAFERLLEVTDEVSTEAEDASDEGETLPPAQPAKARPSRRSRGRRRLDLTKLPVQDVVLDPEEVRATGGEGYRPMGEEISERLAFRPGIFLRLRLRRRKWAALEPTAAASIALARETGPEDEVPPEAPAVVIAPVPACVWPRSMADTSVIAQHIVAKYEDCLPLHRQEKISARHGFPVPRGTQCGWLTEAHGYLRRIVEAMFRDAKANAFCIATDATTAPVRAKGQRRCEKHYVFVFVADQRHVIFRHAPEHRGRTVEPWLAGYRGYALADAASIYEVVYRKPSA